MDDSTGAGAGPESIPATPATEPPLFPAPATEPVPGEPAPVAPLEAPLYVPPAPHVPPAPPVDWPAAAPPEAGPEPPVRWDAPPDSAGIAVPGAPGLVYAGTGARLVAYWIDGIVIGIIGIVLAIAIELALGLGDTGTAVATTAIVVLDLVYFVVLWTGRRRATYGMRLLKLQIGNANDGRTVTGEQAVKRWFGYGQWLSLLAIAQALAGLGNLLVFVWAVILLISVAMNGIHQGLHDRFAGTAIVQTRGSSNALRIGCLLVIGVTVLTLFVSIVALIFLGSQVSSLQTTP